MARTRSHREGYQRRRPRHRNRATTETASGASGLNFAGVDNRAVEQDPSQYIGELFKGAVLSDVSVPDSVEAGGSLTVTGKVRFDSPTQVIFTVGMRVRAEGPTIGDNAMQRWNSIQHGNVRHFSLTLPAPESAGQTMVFTLTGESTTMTGGWTQGTTEGPFRVDVVSESEQKTREALDYTPFLVGGAGAGYALAGVSSGYTPMQGAVAGAALGMGYRGLRKRGVRFIPSVEIDQTTLAAVGLAGIGIAVALNSSGMSDVLGPLGSAAGSAVDAGRSAVGSARGR